MVMINMAVINRIQHELSAYWVDGYLGDRNKMSAAGQRFSHLLTEKELSRGIWVPESGLEAAIYSLRKNPDVLNVHYLLLARVGYVSASKVPRILYEIEGNEQNLGSFSRYRGIVLIRKSVEDVDAYCRQLDNFLKNYGLLIKSKDRYKNYQGFQKDVDSVLDSILTIENGSILSIKDTIIEGEEEEFYTVLEYLEKIGLK